MTALVDVLRSGSDLEATTVLARLRLGEPVEEIVQTLSTNSHVLPDNVETCAVTPGLDSSMGFMVPSSNFELSTDRLAELSTTGIGLDILSGPEELPIPNENGHFLHAIFEREEFLLPGVSHEDDEDPSKQLVVPATFSRTPQSSSTALLRDSDNLATAPNTACGPSSCVTLNGERAFPTDIKVSRHSRAAWATYPNVRDGLATPPSFEVIQTDSSLHQFQAVPTREPSIPSWAMMSVNMDSGSSSMNSAFTRIQDMTATLIQEGTPQEEVFGTHPNIAALFDEEQYKSSSILSQWAASMVHSVKLKGSPPPPRFVGRR